MSFIAPTAFLTGAGFQKMREWLRQRCSDIWVLHLSPEGQQAPAKSQIFSAMRQPVAIVTAARAAGTLDKTSATVRFYMVPPSARDDKIQHIKELADPHHDTWKANKLPPPATEAGWRAPVHTAAGGANGTR